MHNELKRENNPISKCVWVISRRLPQRHVFEKNSSLLAPLENTISKKLLILAFEANSALCPVPKGTFFCVFSSLCNCNYNEGEIDKNLHCE